jgi:hypothetical protein
MMVGGIVGGVGAEGMVVWTGLLAVPVAIVVIIVVVGILSRVLRDV